MRQARDRHLLEWTMASIGVGSLLLGAAMQTETVQRFCRSEATAQVGPSDDCVQNRIAQANARARSAEADRAAPKRQAHNGVSTPNAIQEASDPAPNQRTELPQAAGTAVAP